MAMGCGIGRFFENPQDLDQIPVILNDFDDFTPIGDPIWYEKSRYRCRYQNSCVGTLENDLINNFSSPKRPRAAAKSLNKVAPDRPIFKKSLEIRGFG